MYRGRPPPREEYPPYDDRGPPPRVPHTRPGRPYTRPPFRDDGRPRAPEHHGYYDHGPADTYRRSPPRRRYSSPGSGNDRRSSTEYWGSGPSRDRSPSPPRGRILADHSLVITVGNERTGSGTVTPRNPVPYDRDYPPRPAYDGHDGSRRRSPSRGRSRPRSRSPGAGRSKSRPRSHSRSRSPGRSRARSRARSKSRPRSHSRSRSPDRSRARSRARSKSRPRSHSRSRSPDRSRARSRARSLSRPYSRSRSKSPEQGRGRSMSRAHSTSRARSRGRSRSRSVSTSSTSSGESPSVAKKPDEFKELEMARRRKEMEQMLNRPTKSILKKRVDSEDSPLSVQNVDSPRLLLDSANMSQETERFLTAVKGMEPSMLASVLGELREDPHMLQSAGLNPALSGILGLLEGVAGQQESKKRIDIEDEEKFLYGDEDEQTERSGATEAPSQHGLPENYDDTETALYGDLTSHQDVLNKAYGAPVVVPPHQLGQATSLEPAPRGHQQQQVEMLYHSRSSITPDQNFRIEVPNVDYPPGTGPLDEKEKHEVEEYEKIQDLLKTIGLDLGVTEISKMAARTQERLHGKKPPPKTPTRRPEKRYRSDSSGSSDSGRDRHRRKSHSHSGSSSSSSSRSRSCSSDAEFKRRNKSSQSDRHSGLKKSESSREVRDSSWVSGKTMSESASQSSDHKATVMHPAHAMPAYPQVQPQGLVPPNYPPPGYGQYGNYMPYMTQQWPVYPPPTMGIPPQSPKEDFQNAPSIDRPYLTPVDTSKPDLKENVKGRSITGSRHERRGSEEKNNESQKLKVLEEREILRQDRDIRMKKKEFLMKELERLRKQQGELLRKKRREKDGHKDPLLAEISRLQEEVMSQISVLRKEHEAAEKKRAEIDTVALILGLGASDKSRKVNKASGDFDHPVSSEKREQVRSTEESTSSKMTSSLRAVPDKEKQNASATPAVIPTDPFEYYDAGNHWCQHCNVTSGSMFDFFTHLHSKLHRKTQDPYSRPWALSSTKNEMNHTSGEKMVKPAKGTYSEEHRKGSEFLLPVRGFYCQLCEEFFGDAICAEDHVTSHIHNEKYKKQMYENPLYEQRRNLDRQAGLNLEGSGEKSSELKRKHEQENRESKEEDNPKHIKKERDEDKSKSKKKKKNKEQEHNDDEKPKVSRKEEEKSLFNKKDEEDAYKCFTKEESDRYKYGKEMVEKFKYSKREEDDRYKYGKMEERYPYRREEDSLNKHRREEEERSRYSRVDERPKHSWRDEDDEERFRYSKGREPKPKYDRRNEERYRYEKEEGKPNEDRMSKKDKAWHSKDDRSGSKKQPEKLPEKNSEPPKIISGPSPAMRAKLRKKSEDVIKGSAPAPVAFGKFSWKKKENELAKEAERVAAEFLKEEEAKEAEATDKDEDPYSKSVAIAKSIAIKLSGSTPILPVNSWVPYQSNRGRIRPNLPPPSMVLRKSVGVHSKPAPLNAFLSIRPPSAGTVPPLSDTQSQPSTDSMLPQDIISKAFGGQEVVLKMPDKSESPIPSAPSEVMVTKTEPATTMSVIVMESDIGVPGVPECEQNRTVLVQPPPVMARYQSDFVQKSEKPKSNLAAAKAQDLFDIFYSSGPSSTSFTSKLAEDGRVSANECKRRETLESVNPKTQQSQLQTQPQTEPQAKPQPQTEPQANPQSQTKPQAESQLKSEPQAESQPQTEPQAKSQHQTGLQAKPLPQIEPLANQPQPQTEPQTKPQPQIEPLANQPQPEPECELLSQPQPELELQTQPKHQTEPQPQIHTELVPESYTSAEMDIQVPKDWENGLESELKEAIADNDPSTGTMDIPTETLDLPADVLTLDFDYNFNFE